ncbi:MULTISPECIES: SGNH/GDSL hydrolase family protein [Paraburkholderia]|uniref:Phospholipase/lecithinase/hemolysin n=1 Tax=Paraburkholderia megapolitana TaxID=420953 RepID=A0A1I3W5L5_9BURK|nr:MULTISPECIES: SGNH/GDSL hydrolase family protein [Paraburkholderia]MCX4165961.1 SGNH/GDSL hydrolase family protein [Paraburkholderia megapolitana]MDN7161452.1 SGNH/GDSL hydrolase family protein [Paraburkholderia sp. CHISQ3]MDQ6498499.1 SGNH/GDSL hydrolase family protein [Paraburkholderia megapolitana]QDQ84624.1 lipase [Paraburkholderia megapolitana]SFK02483.1 Phospholipase/lecithinase/hemolysin [Paraburkholderia megapolitana]
MGSRSWSHLVLSCAACLTVSACGGGGISSDNPNRIEQVVSFGDSLSDVGTYAYASGFGGGRYTTNPGLIAVQRIAAHYNVTLTPALTGGFGQPSVTLPNGFGYAQGGARVANPPNPGDATGDTGELQTPVTSQVSAYLSQHQRFNTHQLVLIQAGGNDVQDVYGAWVNAVQSGTDPATALTAVLPTAAQVGTQLAGIVQTLLANGAKHVAVQNVPDLSKTPAGAAAEQQLPGSMQALQQITQALNTALASALPSSAAVLQIDAYTFFNQTAANFQSLGFQYDGSNATQVACGPIPLPIPYAADSDSALFCSPSTYVAPNADQIYMFADAYHPSTHLQQLIAAYEVGLTDAWLGSQN